MALRRHQKNSVRPHLLRRRCTRSSSGLGVAAKGQAHAPPNHGSSRRKGGSTAVREIACNKNGLTRHPQAHQVGSPQRSSLRRAIRESLVLFKRSIQLGMPSPVGLGESLGSSITPVGVPKIAQAELHVSAHQSKCQTHDVRHTTKTEIITTRSSKFSRASVLEPKSQRNSLRRAIRESLKAADARYEHPVPQADSPDPMVSQSLELCLETAEGSKVEARDRAVDGRYSRGNALLSSGLKRKAMPIMPQRSSLRRAVRESRRMIQGDVSVSTTPNAINSGIVLELKTGEDSPQSSDRDSGTLNWSSDSSPAPSPDASSTLPEIDDNARTPSRCTRTLSASSASSVSSALSNTTPQSPSTVATSGPLRTLRPRKRLAQEQPVVIVHQTPQSKDPIPKSPSNLVSGPQLSSTPTLPTSDVQQQILTSASPVESTLGNGKSQCTSNDLQSIATRRGWHQVRGIINEVPGGLYLVEWEGRDPRTRVKWPASWVQAKNVSASAVHDWKTRNQQRALH
ncbi:hypothetical protein F5Y10DRAFT_288326 [Nemania abortiva]|nr:hypothetical protein F5Y10DRAFT_288326 [Nemania abortiva]